jgi:hypothetical protein
MSYDQTTAMKNQKLDKSFCNYNVAITAKTFTPLKGALKRVQSLIIVLAE